MFKIRKPKKERNIKLHFVFLAIKNSNVRSFSLVSTVKAKKH